MRKIINFIFTIISKITFYRIKNYYILDYKPNYEEDGFATSHNAIKKNDNKFLNAYFEGFRTNSSYGKHLKWRIHIACKLSEYCMNLKGDFVELGTNRGFVATSIIKYNNLNRKKNVFYLFDTFDGRITSMLTPVERKFKGIPKYQECYEFVKNQFRKYKNVRIVKGKLPHSLKQVDIKEISFLHIDLNSSKSEIMSINVLWNKIVKGGIILLDDYCYSGYPDTKRTWDKFSLKKKISIIALPTGQGLIIKN